MTSTWLTCSYCVCVSLRLVEVFHTASQTMTFASPPLPADNSNHHHHYHHQQQQQHVIASNCDGDINLITFKALHTGRPPYLTELSQHHQSTRSLCSSSSHQLVIPRHNPSFRSRAFRFSAPRIWNKLPLRIRETQSLPAFKRHLKIHFSSQLTPPPSDPPSNAP